MLFLARFEHGEMALDDDLQRAVEGGELSIMFLNALVIGHARGHWGEVTEEQIAANERAIESGGEIRSRRFMNVNGDAVSIVTTADRSHTILSLGRHDS